MTARCFPPPWSVDDIGAAFVVRDHNGQGLAHVYYEDEPQRQTATKMLTKDKARRIAANIVKLPELLSKPNGLELDSGLAAPNRRLAALRSKI